MIELSQNLKKFCKLTRDFDKDGEHAAWLLSPDQLREAVQKVYEAEFFLEDVTCLDVEEGYLVVHHYDHFETPGRISLRVLVPHDTPKLPSVADIFHGAEWHERECMDFYPVIFEGNPNPSRLLLEYDSTEYPLVKDKKSSVDTLLRFDAMEKCDAVSWAGGLTAEQAEESSGDAEA